MRIRTTTTHAMKRLRTAWGDTVGDELADDRGDVPGWVLVTLMTAGLVIAIWALAGPALADLFQQAIARVSGL
jgi:hypothetical protein